MATLALHSKTPASGFLETIRAWLGRSVTHDKSHDSSTSHDITPEPSDSRDRNAARQYVQQGREKYKQHDFAAAEQLFRKALHSDKNYGRAWLYLGNALNHQGNMQEAVKAWKKATTAEPYSDAAETARAKLQRYSPGH